MTDIGTICVGLCLKSLLKKTSKVRIYFLAQSNLNMNEMRCDCLEENIAHVCENYDTRMSLQ